MSPDNFTQGRLLKIKWLVADVIAVRSPDRVKRAIVGVIWAGSFFSIQAVFVVREPLCGVCSNPLLSSSSNTLLRVI